MRSIKQTENFQEQLQATLWKVSGGTAILKRSYAVIDIPAGKQWRWYLATGRVKVKFDDGDSYIEITKLVPRKRGRKSENTVPKLKLWQGTVVCPSSNNVLTIFWCEKGLDNDYPDDNELNIEDYTFLAKFMNESLCRELWPQLRMCGSFDTTYNTLKWEGYLNATVQTKNN